MNVITHFCHVFVIYVRFYRAIDQRKRKRDPLVEIAIPGYRMAYCEPEVIAEERLVCPRASGISVGARTEESQALCGPVVTFRVLQTGR